MSNAGSDIAIRTMDLTKVYSPRHLALNAINLELEPGSVLGVLGPNGAGKSTLLKLLVGLQRPTSGKVLIFGKKMGPGAGMLRQRIGYMPAEMVFPERSTPIDFLDHVGRLYGMTRTQRRSRLGDLLRATDLANESSRPISVLSTGMKTRLGLAASLIHDPELLIWDEPSHGLDPEARRSMIELTGQLAESKTIVISSHQVGDVQQLCTQALVLDRGQVVFNGDPAELARGAMPSSIEIDIRGDKREIAEAYKSIAEFEELKGAKLNKNQVQIQIHPNASHATALANVLVTLADHKIEMVDLRITGGASDGAIATLLKEENSRGLTRAYQRSQAA
ncbi:ABC transporter ATP-binding protein [bacterium]|jgi:ABC-2 type transport system ATP-binding protein|nr:ABC transporter ATP-binding protein [bacterium]